LESKNPTTTTSQQPNREKTKKQTIKAIQNANGKFGCGTGESNNNQI
jgi:hypothetical protein